MDGADWRPPAGQPKAYQWREEGRAVAAGEAGGGGGSAAAALELQHKKLFLMLKA